MRVTGDGRAQGQGLQCLCWNLFTREVIGRCVGTGEGRMKAEGRKSEGGKFCSKKTSPGERERGLWLSCHASGVWMLFVSSQPAS